MLSSSLANQNNESKIAWLKDNALRLNSLDPNNDNFLELQPLKNYIGDAEIVLLGEQTHGDGTTFLAKTNLVKFLHQEMGFDVLTFEYGLYECHKVWQLMSNGINAKDATIMGLSSVWGGSKQCQSLIDYLEIAKQMSPSLQIAGFDVIKPKCAVSSQYLVTDLTTIMQQVNPKMLQHKEVKEFMKNLQSFVDGNYLNKEINISDEKAKEGFLAIIEDLISSIEITSSLSVQKRSLWRQILKSIKTSMNYNWVKLLYLQNRKQNIPSKYQDLRDRVVPRRSRDRQMADNLIWLATECFPNRKIIGWSATIHNTRNLQQTSNGQYENKLMGDYIWDAMGNKMYSIGFTTYAGSCGGRGHLKSEYNQIREIPPASMGSLEDLMLQAGLENAFIDFRHLQKGSHWLREKIMARPIGHCEMIADWGAILDGLVFTRKTTPSDGFAFLESVNN